MLQHFVPEKSNVREHVGTKTKLDREIPFRFKICLRASALGISSSPDLLTTHLNSTPSTKKPIHCNLSARIFEPEPNTRYKNNMSLQLASEPGVVASMPVFTLFPKLPLELRQMIWQDYMDSERTTFLMAERGERKGIIGVKIPPILHTNREAREYGLQKYTESFDRCGNRFYINFENDRMFFDDEHALDCYLASYRCYQLAQSLQNIIVLPSWDVWGNYSNNIIGPLRRMKGLKTVVLKAGPQLGVVRQVVSGHNKKTLRLDDGIVDSPQVILQKSDDLISMRSRFMRKGQQACPDHEDYLLTIHIRVDRLSYSPYQSEILGGNPG